MTCKILKSAAPTSAVCFGTGYFNPTKEYLDIILNGSKASYDVLVSTQKCSLWVRKCKKTALFTCGEARRSTRPLWSPSPTVN